MSPEEVHKRATAAIRGLKDFQKASVGAIYKNLYIHSQPCMLLADEVGLGKTVVARGLISTLLKKRIENGETSPLKVTYICSNQVIAKENLRKLNPLGKDAQLDEPTDRIAYLALAKRGRTRNKSSKPHEPTQAGLVLNTLTPATSFQTSSGGGNIYERRILYSILVTDPHFDQIEKKLLLLFRGKVSDRYYDDIMSKWHEEHSANRLRSGIAELFLEKVKQADFEAPVGMECEKQSLYEATFNHAQLLSEEKPKEGRSLTNSIVRQLRANLIECCLRYVEADLFILDEFQRFRDLIDSEANEEQAIIANKVFFEQNTDSRILLLSATPFKVYTSHHDLERGEDHFQDFKKVLGFLIRNKEEVLLKYEKARKALYDQLIALGNGKVDTLDAGPRKEVESVLRRVMCRTERNSVTNHVSSLVKDTWKDPDYQLSVSCGDLDNYKKTDRVARALEKLTPVRTDPLEYCKSALFPLSFLENYKLKVDLKRFEKDTPVLGALNASSGAWLDFEEIDQYKDILKRRKGTASNARLSQLVDQAIGTHGDRLLWVPPSLPYYPLEDAFENSDGFSKTLLFSSWVMVPRMVSVLLSYEVERRTIGSPLTQRDQEKETRRYFPQSDKRRYPVPQLTFGKRTATDGTKQLGSMSIFTLMYPSPTLAEIVDLKQNLRVKKSLDEIRSEISQKISEKLSADKIEQYISADGESNRWYWAAPLLLDRDYHFEGIRDALKVLNRDERARSQNGESEKPPEYGVQREHYDYLIQCLEDPSQIGLGPVPENLASVLADVTLGSPAVVALRSLKANFPERTPVEHLNHAFLIAREFRALLNKPESIVAIRYSERDSSRHRWYWQMVLDYCASGCLQSVIDEYFHILKGQSVDGSGAVSRLLQAVNLNAASIKVDDLNTFRVGEPKTMRCHYAVEFGSQRTQTDRKQERSSNIREVFNSPFRPFVVSTTSMGQEGIDFHTYCRKIVHWNLPSNPIDLEQREGRINRFKSLAIRQLLALEYGNHSEIEWDRKDIWEEIFRLADKYERQVTGMCELVPSWHIDSDHDRKIERIVPLYPFSQDQTRLSKLLQTLTLYRLAFGQPRQADLVEHLLKGNVSKDKIQSIMQDLMIDLRPSMADFESLAIDQ